MSSFGFEVAHGYQILKGYVSAENIKEAKQKILNEDWMMLISLMNMTLITLQKDMKQ